VIAFASLWLGLVTGTVPVELIAGPEVARVELRLDGMPCARLAAPPWQGSCELGAELAPHELVALAFARDGSPLGEARQWLNVPREPAELEVVLAPTTGTPPRIRATLAWAGPGGAAPLEVRATLDGEPLPLAAGARNFEIPAKAEGGARLLRVEASFPGGAVAARDLAVGGDLAEQLAQELTGVPVELAGRGERGTLRDGDVDLPVLAVEKGDADLVAVIDPGALPSLDELAKKGSKQRVSRSGVGLAPGPGGRSIAADARVEAGLPDGARLKLVWPVAASHRQGQLRYDLFPTSPERSASDGTLLEQLRLTALLPRSETPPRLADAVALAALTAAQPGRRRVVLLVVGPDPAEASAYDAATVRRFLDRLRVPLVVWSTVPPAASTRASWGDVEVVSSLPRLVSAARHLDALLARQRIAWVEGRHLPQRLQAGADGVLRLATADHPLDDEAVLAAAERLAADAALEAARAAAIASATATATATPPAPVPPNLPRRGLPPFDLATDVRDQRLLAVAGDVAAALPADFAARFGLAPAPGGTVVLFARDDDFRRWLGEQGGADSAVEGFARSGVAALAVGGFRSDEVTALLVHELGHLLTRAAVGRPLPPWLEEGLVEEMAMSRRDARGRTLPGTLRARRETRGVGPVQLPGRVQYEAALTGPVAALVTLVRGPRPALVDLLAMPQESFTAASGRPERYAASALFLRFLLDGEEGRHRDRLRGFLAAVAAGGSADRAALEAALGTTVVELQAPFDLWLRRTAQTMR